MKKSEATENWDMIDAVYPLLPQREVQGRGSAPETRTRVPPWAHEHCMDLWTDVLDDARDVRLPPKGVIKRSAHLVEKRAAVHAKDLWTTFRQ